MAGSRNKDLIKKTNRNEPKRFCCVPRRVEQFATQGYDAVLTVT
jgi:hypothetical protein